MPIEHRGHLRYLCGYILGNAAKHGTAIDPYHEASNLPDLLGLRMIGAYTIQAVRERLPGLTRADLLPHLGRR